MYPGTIAKGKPDRKGFNRNVRPHLQEQGPWRHGGGVRAYLSTPSLSGCVFSGNFSEHGGGGISCATSNAMSTDAGFVHLNGLTKLETLNLWYTKITDTGLAYLKGMTKLKWLDLGFTGVTDAELMHLEGLTSLKRLSLRATKITPAGVKKLQQALPNCRISR